MASLLSLPPELLSLICQSLGVRNGGACNLRLTCHSICLKTQHDFAKAVCSTLRLDLHPDTLERWQACCARPAFGVAVKKLVFSHWERQNVVFPQVEEDELKSFEEQVFYVLKSVFAMTFAAMPNLRETVIVAPFLARFVRHEVVPVTVSSLSGRSKDQLKINQVSITPDILWKLLAQTSVKSEVYPSTLQITRAGKRPRPYYIPSVCFSDHALATESAAMTKLERLSIAVDPSGAALGRALGVMSRLTGLDLHFAPDRYYRSAGERIATENAATRSMRNIYLPCLSTLALRELAVEESVLQSFLLAHHDTLQCLLLTQVELVGDSRWASILRCLHDHLPWLIELHINVLPGFTWPRIAGQRWVHEGVQLLGRRAVQEGVLRLLSLNQ